MKLQLGLGSFGALVWVGPLGTGKDSCGTGIFIGRWVGDGEGSGETCSLGKLRQHDGTCGSLVRIIIDSKELINLPENPFFK